MITTYKAVLFCDKIVGLPHSSVFSSL